MKGIPFKGITLWTEESREAEIAGKKTEFFQRSYFTLGILVYKNKI